MDKRMHVIFQGRVQGVGFRYTALEFAREMGLSGTVQNLSDGSVELFAQGTEDRLKTYLRKLESSFELDIGNGVNVTWLEISPDLTNFRIL